MTKEQKEVQQAHLDEEKKIIRQLKQVYSRAAKDCEEKISALNARSDMQNLQSIIYQKQYQQALKSQIDGILTTLQTNEFSSISEYLTTSYTNGYTGAMYDLTAQGIPVVSPIKQQNVVKALQTDSKISTTLYKTLGEDVTYLKKSIRAELSRGTANGSTWVEIASHIANGMNSPLTKAMNRAILIARTEGHRIQQESQLDALQEAADNGADVVKQWDATLDGRTRPEHQAADGQIVELDEYFKVGGEKLKAPGVGGSARNVCNCRCCLLQRARWALDEDELQTLKTRASFFGLDKTKDFDAFKQKYLKATSTSATISASELITGTSKLKGAMNSADYDEYIKILSKCEDGSVQTLYVKYADGISSIRSGSSGVYYPGDKELIYSYPLQKYIDGGRTKYSTIAHEYGHYFDSEAEYSNIHFSEVELINGKTRWVKLETGKASYSDEFLAAVRKDRQFLKETITDATKADLAANHASSGVQDAIDGLLGERIYWGHGDKYYNRQYNHFKKLGEHRELQKAYKEMGLDVSNLSKTTYESRVYDSASEIWANIMAAKVDGGSELEYVKKYLPNSYQTMTDILKGVK